MNAYFENIPGWGWFILGVAIWFFIQNFILPDSKATWLAQRRNLPTVVAKIILLLAIAALFVFVLNISNAVLITVRQILAAVNVRVDSWVLVLGSIGASVLLGFWIGGKIRRRIRDWRQNRRQNQPVVSADSTDE